MSITAADSTFTLTIIPIFPVPQTIQGYSADAMWTSEAVANKELVLGADDKLSVGWIPSLKTMTVNIMPDQGGDFVFDEWMSYEEALMTAVPAIGTLAIPALGYRYAMLEGYLTNAPPMVSAAKVLVARQFTLTWHKIIRAPL